MNDYVFHAAIKCEDGKIHRLTYDLNSQTKQSFEEFERVFLEVNKRFPGVWINVCTIEELSETIPEEFQVRITDNEV